MRVASCRYVGNARRCCVVGVQLFMWVIASLIILRRSGFKLGAALPEFITS